MDPGNGGIGVPPGEELSLPELEIRVLHVDDDRELLDLSAAALEDASDCLEVETATSGSEALAHLDNERVDCIVSDYQMPGMDGLELLEAVRERDSELPFLLFTGKGSEEIAARAIECGVSGYLQKKGGLDHYTVLANRIETLVDRHRAQQQVRQSLQALEAARDGIAVFDEEGRFRYLNEAYAGMYGYDVADLLGQGWEQLYPDGEVERYEDEIVPQLLDEGGWIGECRCLHSDGRVFESKHSISQLEEGGHVCVIHHGSVTIE